MRLPQQGNGTERAYSKSRWYRQLQGFVCDVGAIDLSVDEPLASVDRNPPNATPDRRREKRNFLLLHRRASLLVALSDLSDKTRLLAQSCQCETEMVVLPPINIRVSEVVCRPTGSEARRKIFYRLRSRGSDPNQPE